MKKFYILLLTLSIGLSSFAQTVIVRIDRENGIGPTLTSTGDNVTAVGLVRGPGVTQSGADGELTYKTVGFNSANVSDAISNQEYLEVAVGADEAFNLEIVRIRLQASRGANGPRFFSIHYSFDDFTSSSVLVSQANLGTAPFDYIRDDISLTPSTGEGISFRLYAWGATGTGADSDLIISGNPLWGQLSTIALPGVTMSGSSTFEGLTYTDLTGWTPSAPNASTGDINALVTEGSITALNSTVVLNNVFITDGSSLVVSPTGNLTTNGNLTVRGNSSLRVRSSSTRFGSFIPQGNVITDNDENLRYDRNVNTSALDGGNDLIAAPFFGEDFGSFVAFNLDNIVFNPADPDFSEKLFGPFDKSVGEYLTLDSGSDADYILESGVGFRAASISDGAFSFRGNIQLGDVDVTITRSGPQFQEWNLIGNPYPSYIRLDQFLALNNDQFIPDCAGIYGYNGNADDIWTIWNLAYSALNPNAVITPGQGFLVASENATGSVGFRPAMRSTGTTDDFILGRNQKSSYLKLSMATQEKSYSTEFYFIPNTTRGMDVGYDATVFNYTAPNFAIYSELVEDNIGYDMAIQTVGVDDMEKTVFPLGINASQGQQLTISMTDMKFSDSEQVYLEDRLNNTFTLLNEKDYTFTSDTNLNGIGRFYLNVRQETLSTENESFDSLTVFYSKESNSIRINGLIKESTIATLYDIQGRIVKSEILDRSNQNNEISVENLSKGLYLLDLSNSAERDSRKIIIR